MRPAALAALRAELDAAGIAQQAIADAVQPRPVSRAHVCNVLAGRIVSAPVIAACRALLAAHAGKAEVATGRTGADNAEPPLTATHSG